MGSVNNVKVRKPHGSKSIAGQHKRCAPKGLAKINFSIPSNKLNTNKSRSRRRVKAGSAS